MPEGRCRFQEGAVVVMSEIPWRSRDVDRRSVRLHDGEPVWLRPAVAVKKKESVDEHG